MSDHAAEAQRLAELAASTYGQIELRNGSMSVAQELEQLIIATVAQTCATLALVEQQRVANLIALGQFRVGVTSLPPFRHLVMEPVSEDAVAPVAEIREALGL